MKFLPSQLAYLTTDREARANLGAFSRDLGFLGLLIARYAVPFHLIKLDGEHEQHSCCLEPGAELVMLGSHEQRTAFERAFGR